MPKIIIFLGMFVLAFIVYFINQSYFSNTQESIKLAFIQAPIFTIAFFILGILLKMF